MAMPTNFTVNVETDHHNSEHKYFKGTLMQNWISLFMFALNLTTRKVYEILIYKHTETIEYVKK